MPSTKPFSVGAWAITLLAMITSARLPSASEPLRQVGAEELAQGRHAGRLGRRGLVRSRVDAEHGDARARRSSAAGSRRC